MNTGWRYAVGYSLVSDLAFDVEGSCRSVALGIQQMIELSQLLVNEALEQVAPAQ